MSLWEQYGNDGVITQEEMERRYKLFSESNGATNIKEYNQDCEAAGKSEDKLPIIIFILDEYADLVVKSQTEKRFIKMGSTFFNSAIMDYIKPEEELE